MMRPVWDLPLSPRGIELELDTGQHVRIRPIRAADREGLLAAYDRFSPESRYFRFFGPTPVLGERLIEALTDIDDTTQLAWAVFDPAVPSEVDDGSGLVIASARLFIDEDDEQVAEGTLAVVDDYQRQGLGRFLIELLVATAADHGIGTIRLEVLHENRGMRALLSKLGASAHRLPDDASVVEYRLEIPDLPDDSLPAGALYALLRRLMSD